MSKYFLGIDIGTYETKGVIVSKTGEIISQAATAMLAQANQQPQLVLQLLQ